MQTTPAPYGGEGHMYRKLIAAVAPLVVVGAVAFAPAVAQASPHWYLNGTLITKKKTTKTAGTLTFSMPEVSVTPVTCLLQDSETIENPAGGGAGIDQMTQFKLTNCMPNPCPMPTKGSQAALKVTAGGLPWKTELVPSIFDKISSMEIVFSCKKAILASFSGTLAPAVLPGNLTFVSPFTGELHGLLGSLGVSGTDTFSTPGINAKEP